MTSCAVVCGDVSALVFLFTAHWALIGTKKPASFRWASKFVPAREPSPERASSALFFNHLD